MARTVSGGESESLYCKAAPPGALVVTVGRARMAKSWLETSKKTLPTASTFTRAWTVPTLGRSTVSAPSFGVLAASSYGYVWPPSKERLIRTSAVWTGARFVWATSQVTVCVDPPA